MKEYIVSLSQVRESFSEECLDLALEWASNGCADITCILNDDKTEVKILVPDYCVDSCVDLKITCTTCKSKEVKNIRVCPCDSDDDCPKPCETCGPLGYCISDCSDDKICTDTGCGDCDENNPCIYPFICENNICVCEDGYKVGKECWSCNPEDPNGCPPGKRCTKDGCVDICEDKHWSQELEECVDCTVNAHCKGIKICTPEGYCECPEGYYEDPNDPDNCLEIGCTEDDLENCLECDLATGILSPKQCPKGWFKKAGTCDCVKECPCDTGPCDEKEACVKDASGRCYCDGCEEVENPQSQDDCCEGFYWDGTDCVVNPCKGTCENGCEDGCICDGELCIPGNDDEEGCLDDFTSEYEDCVIDGKLVTELSLDSPCECDELTVNTKLTSNTVSGDDNILSFKMEIRKGHGDITNYLGLPRLDDTFHANITDNELPISGMVSLEVIVYYNILNDDGIIIGESHEQPVVYPSNIGASITNKAFYEFEDVKVPIDGTLYDENKVVKSVVLGIIKTSNWFFHSQCNYKGEQVLASYVFNKNLFIDHLVGDLELIRVTNLMSLSPRNPIFSYFLSEDSNYEESESIRKGYIGAVSGSGNVYRDLVYGPGDWNVNKFFPLDTPEGRILSNMNLLVTNDCGCPDASVVDHGKLVVCSPCKLDAKIVACGKGVEIFGVFEPDPINQDLTQFDDHSTGSKYISNHPSQVKWELVVNGSNVIATFIHDKAKGMIEETAQTSMFQVWDSYLDGNGNKVEIESAFLRHIHDDSGKCNMFIDVDFELIDMNEVIECASNGRYTVTVDSKIGGSNISRILPSTINSVLIGGKYILTLDHREDTIVTYEFDSGCEIVRTYNEDCCDLDVIIRINDTGGDLVRLYVDSSGGGGSLTYVWTKGTEVITDREIDVASDYEGRIYVVVTDSDGCEDTAYIDMGSRNPVGLDIEFDSPLCGNDTTDVVVRATNGEAGSVKYTVKTIAGVFFTDGTISFPSNGTGSITDVAGGYSIVFTDLVLDGIARPDYIDSIVINKVDSNVSLSVSSSQNTVCIGESMDITVSGPSGTMVTVSRGGYSLQEELTGVPMVFTVEDTDTPGVNVYNISGTIGSCPVTGDQVSLTVIESSPITMSDICISGDVIVTFSEDVQQVIDNNGTVLNITAGNQVTLDQNVTSITVTPLPGGCSTEKIFTLGTDWVACGCAEYDAVLEYKINNEAWVPYVSSVTVDQSDNITFKMSINLPNYTNVEGLWYSIPAGVSHTLSNNDTEITLYSIQPNSNFQLSGRLKATQDGVTDCLSTMKTFAFVSACSESPSIDQQSTTVQYELKVADTGGTLEQMDVSIVDGSPNVRHQGLLKVFKTINAIETEYSSTVYDELYTKLAISSGTLGVNPMTDGDYVTSVRMYNELGAMVDVPTGPTTPGTVFTGSFGTVTPADLTYNSGDVSVLTDAIEVVINNYAAGVGKVVENLRVSESGGIVSVKMDCVENPSVILGIKSADSKVVFTSSGSSYQNVTNATFSILINFTEGANSGCGNLNVSFTVNPYDTALCDYNNIALNAQPTTVNYTNPGAHIKSCAKITLQVNNQCVGSTYEWTDAADTVLGTDVLLLVEVPGVYTVDVTCPDGCVYIIEHTVF